jgi:hypothetical protein
VIHPDTELRFISPEKGYGVVATKPIPKGTITWVLDDLDQHFTGEEIARMAPHYQEILYKYCYRDPRGLFVLCWDNARCVNHSFRSNCISTAYNFEIAVRDIAAGEELTDDYGYLNLWEPFHAAPEEGSERTTVYPDDLLHYHGEWDAQLKAAFPNLAHVSQPLQHFLDEETRRVAHAIATGVQEMESTLHCYYAGDVRRLDEASMPGTL